MSVDPIVRVFQSELDQLRADLAQAIEARDEFEAAYVTFHEKAEQAEARVDDLTDTLKLRSDALNATGRDNDALRARLAAVSALGDKWEREADEIRQSEGEERDGPSTAMVGIAHGRHKSAIELRAALDKP